MVNSASDFNDNFTEKMSEKKDEIEIILQKTFTIPNVSEISAGVNLIEVALIIVIKLDIII